MPECALCSVQVLALLFTAPRCCAMSACLMPAFSAILKTLISHGALGAVVGGPFTTLRATVLHEYSATGGHNSAFKTALVARNRVWLLYKNMPETLLRRHWFSSPVTLALLVLLAALLMSYYVLHGRLQGLRHLPQLRTDRLKTLTSARLHPDEIDALLAPAMTPRQYLRYRHRLDALVSRDEPS